MKTFAVVLLCFFAAVQGRSTGGQERTTDAALGENPWVVHARVAVSTSGLLNSCIGSLISDRWVLTSARCVRNVRFIWLRYGAVDVVRPQLVTETSTVRVHPSYDASTGENDIALININRAVEFTDYISDVALPSPDAERPLYAKLCRYGTNDNGGPGETLNCITVSPTSTDDGNLQSCIDASEFDIGAPLVTEDGVQIGVLSYTDDGAVSKFMNVVNYLDWIVSTTGIATPADKEVQLAY